jgi:hypothetical protein
MVRLDPFSGRCTLLYAYPAGFNTLEPMNHDSYRDRLVLKQADSVTQFFLIDAQGRTSTLPVDWPHSVFLWAPTGDGRLYMVGKGEAGGRPFGYLDADDHGHDLLGLDGSLQRLDLRGSSNSCMIYDLGTDSLFVAEGGQSTGTVVYKLPLTPDGSRLRAPVETLSFDIYAGSPVDPPEGISAGPLGAIFLKLDVNSSQDGVLMLTMDPVSLDLSPFALMGGITATSTIGTYNSAIGAALDGTGVINTTFNTNRVRRFTRAAGRSAAGRDSL